MLLNADSASLKKLMDIALRSLRLHPLNRGVLRELQRQLQFSHKVNLRNQEVIFYKSGKRDLYLMPVTSAVLQQPVANGNELVWNGQTRKLAGQQCSNYLQYRKIYQNGMQREISELLRQRGVPEIIRKNIPVLVRDSGVQAVLTGMFDSDLEDIRKTDG